MAKRVIFKEQKFPASLTSDFSKDSEGSKNIQTPRITI